MSTPQPDKLLAFCQRLRPNDVALLEDVRLSITDPTAYWQRLNGEPITLPVDPELPWNAVFGGLMEREQIAVLNWRTAGSDIVAAVDYLLTSYPQHEQLMRELESIQRDDSDIANCIRLAGII